jgi:hypothetical protein
MILDALDDFAAEIAGEGAVEPPRRPEAADAVFLALDLGFLAALAALPIWAPFAMGIMLGLL